MHNFKSEPLYFGKCPVWGDFIRSKGTHTVIQMLDQWIDHALAQAMQSSEFEYKYAQLEGIDLYIANPQSTVFLIANVHPSHDRGGRPYPMLFGYLLEITRSQHYLSQAPYMYCSLSRVLGNFNQKLCSIRQTSNLQTVLDQFLEYEIYSHNEQDFHELNNRFEALSWEALADLMHISVNQLNQSLIALGFLLQAVQGQSLDHIDRVILLPLGDSEQVQYAPVNDTISSLSSPYFVASFWMNLIGLAVAKQNTEVMYAILHQQSPSIVVSLQGAHIDVLRDMMLQDFNNDRWISLMTVEWVDTYLADNASLAVLEQHLNYGNLNVNQVITLFKHSFFHLDQS